MTVRARFVQLSFALPSLLLPLATSLALAQPPETPSTVKVPPANMFRGPVAPPDPPQITPEELQTLTGGPTLVTFSGAGIDVEDAATALLDAAHLSKSVYQMRDGKKAVDIDWQRTPFWTAAAQLEKLSGRTWNSSFGGGLALMQFEGEAGMGLNEVSAAQTPFVTLIPNSMMRTSTRIVSFNAKRPARTEPEQVRVNLTAYFDPKLLVQSSTARSLTFEKPGEAAPVALQENRFMYGSYGRPGNNLISQVMLSFPPAATAGTKFSRITGVLHNVVVSARETLVVPDLIATPKVTKTIGNRRYELQDAVINGDELTVRVLATADNAERQNPFGFNSLGSLQVRDNQGHDLLPSGSTTGGGKATFNYRLKTLNGVATKGPYSLDWTIPTSTRSLDVPFELRDVEVP
jgi:hypothetical protein